MKFSQILSRRWLGIGLVLFTGTAVLHAQVHPTPGVNLFGDEVVKKLQTDQGMRFFRTATPQPDDKPKQKVEGFAHALIFQDGSQIRGEIVALNQKEILWSRPDVSEPIRFRREDVRRIVLTPSTQVPRNERVIVMGQKEPAEDKSQSGFATVKLPGGDWLYGELSSEDGQSFSLKLGEQTSFTLGREAISWFYSADQPAPAFAFSGSPLDAESWLARSPGAQFEVKEGTLVIKGTTWIGREVASFRRFEMVFEIPEDAEDFTQVWLQPYGPNVNSYSQGTIQMQLGRKEFQHTAYSNQMVTVSTPLPKELGESVGPVRYRLLYDGPGERLVVFRNGHQLGNWKLRPEENKQQMGNVDFRVSGICFQRQSGRNNPLKLNRVQVQPWDGVLSNDTAAAGAGECLLSAEGKTRLGQLEALSKNEISFSGEKSERKSGIFLQFAHDSMPIENPDAMLLFGDLGEVSTANLEIRDGKARFKTVFAPALEASLSTLQTIAFPTLQKPADAKPRDILVFKNGDEMPGFLIATASSEPWRWRTPDGQEITIRPDHIAGFRTAAGNSVSEMPQTATVELRNGDRLRGELAGSDNGQIQFRHAQLGVFGLEQKQLWSLYPNPNLMVTDGSQNPARWMGLTSEKPEAPEYFFMETAEGNRWIYLDGSYLLRPDASSNGSSSAQLWTSFKKVPDRFELRFDVTNTEGAEPNMILSLTSTADGGHLQAQISYGRLYAYSYSRKNRNSRSKQIQFTDKLTDPTTRRNLRVFVDSKRGTADLFLEGVLLTRIGQQEGERLPGLGDSIRLQPYPQQGSTVFSNIWIGPWNGELPVPGAESAPAISLINGDVATGAPTDFRDGKLLLESDIGPLELPLDRVLAVEFGGTLASKAPAARIRLGDGCAIAVETFRWDGEQVVAHSETLGDLQIPAKLISELVLSPAAPRAPKNPPAKQVAKEGGE